MRQAVASPTAGDDGDPGADGVAVGGRPFQPERDEVAARGPVVEVGQGLVLGQDQGIDAAVVVEVARRQAAAEPGARPGGAGPVETSARRPPASPASSCAGMA